MFHWSSMGAGPEWGLREGEQAQVVSAQEQCWLGASWHADGIRQAGREGGVLLQAGEWVGERQRLPDLHPCSNI